MKPISNILHDFIGTWETYGFLKNYYYKKKQNRCRHSWYKTVSRRKYIFSVIRKRICCNVIGSDDEWGVDFWKTYFSDFP